MQTRRKRCDRGWGPDPGLSWCRSGMVWVGWRLLPALARRCVSGLVWRFEWGVSAVEPHCACAGGSKARHRIQSRAFSV